MSDAISPIKTVEDLHDELIHPVSEPNSVDWMADFPEGPDMYWRFHGFVDFWGADPVGNIDIERWVVLRRTPKGVWLVPSFVNKWNAEKLKKFVLNGSRKKFAYPTKREAWESYCIRLKWRKHYWETEGNRVAKLESIVAQENAARGSIE